MYRVVLIVLTRKGNIKEVFNSLNFIYSSYRLYYIAVNIFI